MNVPTPLNDSARDDRFDRGLEQLLQANPAGLDEIEPELQDITVQMVRLANDAGWIGTDPGEHDLRSTPRWRDLRLITNAIAAAALIGVVLTLAWFGVQYLNDQPDHYGSEIEPTPMDIQPASCDRIPRSDAEIAAIVRKPEEQVAPFQATSAPEGFPYIETLQVARDWNECLVQGNWLRATAYESEYFIWMVGREMFPDGTETRTDAEIAQAVLDFHHSLTPIDLPEGVELSSWATQGYVTIPSAMPSGRDNEVRIIGLEVWAAWLENNEWVEYWPLVVKVEWDGTQWVIVSTSQDSIPNSPYKPSNSKPESTPRAAAN